MGMGMGVDSRLFPAFHKIKMCKPFLASSTLFVIEIFSIVSIIGFIDRSLTTDLIDNYESTWSLPVSFLLCSLTSSASGIRSFASALKV